MNVSPLVDKRHLATAATIGMFSIAGVADHVVSLPLSFGTSHRRVAAYDPPYQLQGCGIPLAGNAYRPFYYVPTLHAHYHGMSDSLRLLDDIRQWTESDKQLLVGDLFPSPLVHVCGDGGVFLDVDAAQYERLVNIHNVVEHVHAVTGYDAQRTAEAISPTSTPDGNSALTHLSAGRYDEAYVAAIRTLRRPRKEGLATGRGTRRAPDATVAFLDDED